MMKGEITVCKTVVQIPGSHLRWKVEGVANINAEAPVFQMPETFRPCEWYHLYNSMFLSPGKC